MKKLSITIPIKKPRRPALKSDSKPLFIQYLLLFPLQIHDMLFLFERNVTLWIGRSKRRNSLFNLNEVGLHNPKMLSGPSPRILLDLI